MKRRSARGATIAVLLLGLLIFGLVFYTWNTAASIFQPVDAAGQGKTIPIQIQKGETAAQIADDLQAKGLIHNALAFRLWARIKGLDAQLQPGLRKGARNLLDAIDFWDRHIQHIGRTGEQLVNDIADGHARVQVEVATGLQLRVQAFDARPQAECQRIVNQSLCL